MSAARGRISTWALTATLWLAYATFDVVQSYLAELDYGDGAPFLGYAAIVVPDAILFWTPLTLAFLALSRRLPLGYDLWPRGAAKLALAILAALFARGLYSWLVNPVIQAIHEPWYEPLPPLPEGLLNAIYPQHVKVLLVACLSFAWVQIRRTYEHRVRIAELETRLTRARLDALSAQLNPHFLFNVLNSIAELIHRDAHAAEHMLRALATLLRFSLANPRDEIRVGEEVTLVAHFLSIEKIRYGDRLDVRWSVDADCADALLPALILQPLAENAIVHGIARRRAAGTVGIAIRRTDSTLVAEVSNDAPPASATGTRGHGVGLANARDRLQCLYGDAWSLTQTLRDETYVVRIELPLRDAPALAGPAPVLPSIA